MESTAIKNDGKNFGGNKDFTAITPGNQFELTALDGLLGREYSKLFATSHDSPCGWGSPAHSALGSARVTGLHVRYMARRRMRQ